MGANAPMSQSEYPVSLLFFLFLGFLFSLFCLMLADFVGKLSSHAVSPIFRSNRNNLHSVKTVQERTDNELAY
jgi:hypothetical protein